jgi:hypothetical protein
MRPPCIDHRLPTHPHFYLKNPTPNFARPYLCQYCHCHSQTTTIRTALISSFQRHHCQTTTVTPHATTMYRQSITHSSTFLFEKFNPQLCPTISRLILPLPCHIWYHSNRPDLLFPTAPLPPCHCHSSYRYRVPTIDYPLIHIF